MHSIAIISSSIRPGRKSHRVALYLQRYLAENNIGNAEILDLAAYDFPIFNDRMKDMKTIPANVKAFADKFSAADGIIIVTPEYNGGYPASLKNAVDLLLTEWKRKPVAIATCSAGPFAGTQCLYALQFSLWKLKAWTVPAQFSVPNLEKSYDENGKPLDPETAAKMTRPFIDELTWCIDAGAAMKK